MSCCQEKRYLNPIAKPRPPQTPAASSLRQPEGAGCRIARNKIVSNFFQETKLLHERLSWPDDAWGVGYFMIKTVIGSAYLLIFALLGLLALVGGVAKLVRLIRRLGSMRRDDLEHEINRLVVARQSSKRWRKKEKGPVPLPTLVIPRRLQPRGIYCPKLHRINAGRTRRDISFTRK
jgi:hypothetical protein